MERTCMPKKFQFPIPKREREREPIVCINTATSYYLLCTDGYILDVFGTYKATTSDTTMMSELMHEESPLHVFLLPDDVLILGFGMQSKLSKNAVIFHIYHKEDKDENNWNNGCQ